VGQVVNLRGGWLPPLFRANAVNRRPDSIRAFFW
jgi:hypothetical protein